VAEWASAGRIAGHGLGTVVDVVAGMHDAIVQRVEETLPPVAAEVAGLHRGHAARVYQRVGAAHRRIPEVLGQMAPERGEPVTGSRAGQVVLPLVHGLWGDHLAGADEPLTIRMAVRRDGRDVRDIAGAFPEASEHLVVFVHGLFEDERAWDSEDGSFGCRLERDRGVTSLHIRYNSGLRISENGRLLSDLLDTVVGDWPVPVASMSLVGHSMGGLVARSAAHQSQGRDWQPLLATVVTLGTPHLGSPVEKSVHVGDWVLRSVPQTRPLGHFLTRRSVGIKDLRYGALVTQDWDGHDPDEFLRDRCTQVPLLDDVTYYWVAATIAQDSSGTAARMFGDGMVREASASGRGEVRRIPFDMGVTVGGVNHMAVMRDDAVYSHLVEWLDPDRLRPASGPFV
jgi:pimeloyl-ACP methyl ester carboxylesterase